MPSRNTWFSGKRKGRRMDFRGGQVTNGGGNLGNEDRFGQV